mmetsp:Transcript_25361/g.30725  ORF Transcript_25361/g.30725 Transcript_25361/m.30725 type:complete len:305 (-) Transcript_25361:290-1204(-)|eukprot:CAMPEP_0197866318 /NCGR_PEP_ID=MMETSP1438-20131217/44150_1 /TAXON_ID=1461541 /ORGANISM="Pterosperma sp., Strain CCMP1384" /LENGTH=304 /DNA_ID=CAMNT_0043484877 /DNA_START=104 /DNA_END=1018 /DNA_ORIENTATION=+
MATESVESVPALKQLGFVKAAAESVLSSSYYSRACGLYTGLHDHRLLKPAVERLESSIGGWVEQAPETLDHLLVTVDSKVDNGVGRLSDFVKNAKESGNNQLSKLKTTVDAASSNSYLQANLQSLKSVEKTVSVLRERGVQLPAELYKNLNQQLQTSKVYLEGVLAGTTKFSLETYEVLQTKVIAAWESFSSHPTVKEALTKLTPALVAAKNRAVQLKESDLSKKYVVPAAAKVGTYVTQVQETGTYKQYVDPYVQKALSTEAYALVEKRVAELIESLNTLPAEKISDEHADDIPEVPIHVDNE